MPTAEYSRTWLLTKVIFWWSALVYLYHGTEFTFVEVEFTDPSLSWRFFHRSSKISAALFQNHIIHFFIIRRLTWFAVNSKILHEYGLEITTNHWWLHHGCWRWHDFLHFLLAAKQKRGPKNFLFSCLHFCALKSR